MKRIFLLILAFAVLVPLVADPKQLGITIRDPEKRWVGIADTVRANGQIDTLYVTVPANIRPDVFSVGVYFSKVSADSSGKFWAEYSPLPGRIQHYPVVNTAGAVADSLTVNFTGAKLVWIPIAFLDSTGLANDTIWIRDKGYNFSYVSNANVGTSPDPFEPVASIVWAFRFGITADTHIVGLGVQYFTK